MEGKKGSGSWFPSQKWQLKLLSNMCFSFEMYHSFLKNNNTYHLLPPFIIDKIWAEFDCENPFQHEYQHADEEVLQSNSSELSLPYIIANDGQLSPGTHMAEYSRTGLRL